MLFTIRNVQANMACYRAKILRNAKLIIMAHTLTAGETRLNDRLLHERGIGLKNACLYLLAKCRISRNYDKEMIITFPNNDDDELAAFITYGDGRVKGSNLLKDAFFRD